MKSILTTVVFITVIACALAAKAPTVQVVDSGSFGVFVNGRRVATETFKIEQHAGGSMARSELKVEDGSAQRSEMELTDRGDIVRYGWQQEKPTKAELSVVPKDEFLSEMINAGPNQKTYSVPHLMPHSTPILDDNFFLHREILIWRYLAIGCTPKPEGLSEEARVPDDTALSTVNGAVAELRFGNEALCHLLERYDSMAARFAD